MVKMIKEFYVLLKSGESLFHKVYGENRVDESLFSGFLGAVYTFAREIGHGDIKTMEMGDAKFICEVSGKLIFVVVVEKEDNEQEIKNFLRFSINAFLNRFGKEIEGWRGDVTVFRSFSEDLDVLVEDYQMKSLPGKVRLAPFLRDDSNDLSPYPFDIEVASVVSLLEDVRSRGGGLFRKRAPEELTGVVRVLWPLWIVPYKNGDRVVVIDAMSTDFLPVKINRSLSLERVESLLKVRNVEEFIDTIERLLADSKSEAINEFPLYGFLEHEMVQEIGACLSQARLSDTAGYVVVRPLISQNQAVENKNGFVELVEELKGYSQKLVESVNLVSSVGEKWINKIREKIEATKELYRVKIEETVKDVENQIEILLRLREEELRGIDAWLAEEDKNLVLEIKNLFGPLVDVLEDVALKSTEEIERKVNNQAGMLGIISGRIEKLVNVSEYMNKTKKLVEKISKNIKKIDSTIEKITKKTESEKNSIVEAYDKKIEEQKSRIDMIREEREAVLNEQRELLERVEGMLEELKEALIRVRSEVDQLIGNLDSLVVSSPEKLYSPSLFYIPLYVSRFEDVKSKRLFVVPPLILSKTRRTPTCTFGQKTLPLDMPNPLFLEALMRKVEKLINENKELKYEIERAFSEKNILDSRKIETYVYEGLNNLLRMNMLNERSFEMLQGRVEKIFRKEERI